MLESAGKHKSTVILALVLVIVGLLAVLHWYRPPQSGLWIRNFLESMHVALFGTVAMAWFGILSFASVKQLWLRVFLAILLTSLLGAGSELMQINTQRDASVEDFELDLIGATAGLLVLLGYSKRWIASRYTRRGMFLGGVGLAVFGMWPLVVMSAAYLERNHQRPIILSFDNQFGKHFRLMQNATLTIERNKQGGAGIGRIRLKDSPWPGIILHDIWPDWSSFSKLVVDFELPGTKPLPLNIRIHDLEHRKGDQAYSDRFNRSFVLQPGSNRLTIPLLDVRNAPRNRQIDLANIDGIVIFGSDKDAGMEFDLEQIRLE